MEKVIYGTLYERTAENIQEMIKILDYLYNFEHGEKITSTWEQHLEALLVQLRTNRDKIKEFLQQKREKYILGAVLP